MRSRPADKRSWPVRRWLLVVAVIFVVQYGFITWLGQPAIDTQFRGPRRVPVIAMLAGSREVDTPGVRNPTLLVLPSRDGFSGKAWLEPDPVADPARPWTEPARPLPPDVEQFGGTLHEFSRGNLFQRIDVARKPQPSIPEYLPIETVAQSTYRIEGDAARRRLLSNFKLESKPAAEILSNSVVQIAVDPAGNVFSAVLLGDGKCGSPEADADALALARSARFEPVVRDGPDRPVSLRPTLDWGLIVFHWNTVPLPSTNAVPTSR